MASVDFFSVVMTYIITNGKLLFALFGLGLSFFVNRVLSSALLSWSVLNMLLYFMYSDVIFIALAGLSLVVGLFLKNAGQ